jgi:glycosyltransferase involved in cell wall biosynthesis
MTLRAICFFPHNPFPPKSGAHKRCLEILSGLRKLGYEVTLASSTLSSETVWDDYSIKQLEAEFVAKVIIYKPSFFDWRFISFFTRFYQLFQQKLPLDSVTRTPIGMRWWFSNSIEKISPQVILMNYCFWDGLLNHQKRNSTIEVIETHDLFTVNDRMREALRIHLPSAPIQLNEVNEAILQEDFFDKLSLDVSLEELQIFDRYDRTIAIARNEFEIIQKNTQHTSVSLLPMTQTPLYLENQYTDPPIFTTGPNLFNTQGYLYFAKRVLPTLLAKIPVFELQVTGSCCQQVTPIPGIVLLGFVPDLKLVYASAKFLVCPVFGGTGQQVKIVEAMAHGLPVVALAAAAKMSPIEHGVNGFVANNATEFANYVIQLWQNPVLCRQLGTAARAKIADDFSEQRLLQGLKLILEPRSIRSMPDDLAN